MIKDKQTGVEYVLAIGGQITGPEVLNSTEIWDPTTGVWTIEARFSSPMEEGQVVRPEADRVCYVGGRIPGIGPQTSIMCLTCTNKVKQLA